MIGHSSEPVDNNCTSFDYMRGLSACRSHFYDAKDANLLTPAVTGAANMKRSMTAASQSPQG